MLVRKTSAIAIAAGASARVFFRASAFSSARITTGISAMAATCGPSPYTVITCSRREYQMPPASFAISGIISSEGENSE
jgi:hypothetical protein